MADRQAAPLPVRETPPEMLAAQRAIQARVPSLGLGFRKTNLDPEIHARLLAHLRANTRRFRFEEQERWVRTDNPSGRPSLVFLDEAFNRRLLLDLKPVHEAWAGRPLNEAACYGIRAYQAGSYLFAHVDRPKTHVVSATICIDCRVSEPWPLYIEDLAGKPHQVPMAAGEMVFYESAKLLHGRPYPLAGDYYATIFVHYTPLDWHVAD